MRALKRRPPRSGSSPSTRHVPAVAPAVALEDLDRRRLAGTVRPEEREDLAGLDGEGEPVQDLALSVGLAEVRDGDCAHGGRGYRRCSLLDAYALTPGRPAHPLGAPRPRLAVARRSCEAVLDGRRDEAEAQLAVAAPGRLAGRGRASASCALRLGQMARRPRDVRSGLCEPSSVASDGGDDRVRRLPRPAGDDRARARQGGARLHGLSRRSAAAATRPRRSSRSWTGPRARAFDRFVASVGPRERAVARDRAQARLRPDRRALGRGGRPRARLRARPPGRGGAA